MLKKEFQILDGKAWKTTFETTDPESVTKDLAAELLHKYTEKALYIRRIVRVQHYTHKTITVYYSAEMGGGRAVYTVPAHF